MSLPITCIDTTSHFQSRGRVPDQSTVKRQFRELNVTPLRANYEVTVPIVAKGLFAEQKRGLCGA